MISSTMMNGATRSRARTARNAAEPTTIAVSHNQVGTLASALPKLDLGEAAGDLPRLGRLRRDPDVCRGLAHVAQDRVRDGAPSSGRLERRDVQLCDPLEAVLSPGKLARVRPHRRSHVW